MRINVNGTPREVTDDVTVEELIEALKLPPDGKGIAVAVNDTVVPRSRWGVVRIGENDSVEVIHAVQGG